MLKAIWSEKNMLTQKNYTEGIWSATKNARGLNCRTNMQWTSEQVERKTKKKGQVAEADDILNKRDKTEIGLKSQRQQMVDSLQR